MEGHVLDLARAFAKGAFDVVPRFDDPLFDEVLDDMAPRVRAVVGDDEFNDFVSSIEAEALETLPAIGPGEVAGHQRGIFTKLFFVPVHGNLLAIRDLLADDRTFQSLVTSFRSRGLVLPDTNLVLSREPLQGRHLVDMPAAAMRGIVESMVAPLHDAGRGGLAGRLEGAVRRALPHASVGPDMLQDGVPVLGSRVLVGVRQTHVAYDERTDGMPTRVDDYVENFVDPRVAAAVDADGDTNVAVLASVEGPWLRAVNALSPECTFEPPCDLVTAIGAVACNALVSPLATLRVRAGIAPDAVADRIHCHWGDDVTVLVEHGGVVLGPATVPALFAARAVDAFMDALVGLGGRGTELLDYVDGNDMPRPDRTMTAVAT